MYFFNESIRRQKEKNNNTCRNGISNWLWTVPGDKVKFIKQMADLETSSEDVQTIVKDKMTEVIRITDKNKNKCCLWKCMMIQGLKMVIIPWIIWKDISLSSSQQDGYSSSKFKDIVYPTLKKWSLIYWHTLSPSHLINIWTDCKHGLNNPGKYLHFEESTGVWIHMPS